VTGIAEQLSCQELVELVTDYLEGALPPRDRTRFEAHIAECDGCQAYVEQIRVTIALSGTLGPEQLDPAAEERLLEAFRDCKRRP
jgi:anti-sigma factor RsiW